MWERLVCKAIGDEQCVSIISPLIGRVDLLIGVEQIVTSGQVIGTAVRMNSCFTLTLPEIPQSRVVSLKSGDRLMPLEYGQVIMEVSPNVSVAAAPLTTHAQEAAHSSVDAPMDGMFYLSPSPKDPPYVNVGDIISPGQTIGLMEVMKCFYPLKYQGNKPVQIIDIPVKSASPVSLGARLMIVRLLQQVITPDKAPLPTQNRHR